MDVNAIAATIAKLPPPPLPMDSVGEAFADYLQASDSANPAATSAPPGPSSTAPAPTQNPPAPTQNPPAPQGSAPISQQDATASSNSATVSTAAQPTPAGSSPDSQDSVAPDDQDATAAQHTDPAAAGAPKTTDGGKSSDGEKTSSDAKSDDTSGQDAAAVLLTLLTATANPTPTASATGTDPSGKASRAADATIGAAKGADALAVAAAAPPTVRAAAAASAVTTQAGQTAAKNATDSESNGPLQLVGFKAVAAASGVPTQLSGGNSNPLADQLAGTDTQISLNGNPTGSPPQSLLSSSLLAAANAISESGGTSLLPSLDPTSIDVGQKPGAPQPVLPTAEAPATTNPIVDAQTGQPQPSGAAFVATANTSVAAPQSTASAQSAAQPTLLNAPVEQVALHMAKAAADNVNRINIQLNPADLGRVDVKMEVGHDGHVLATIAADRPQTLEMLQRDAAGLHRALQDAGLNTDGQSLSFSLRQDNGQANGSSGQSAGSGNQRNADSNATVSATLQPMTNRADDVGLDIRV